MAHGGNFVLDKGWKVLSTYNTSAAAGVTRFRAVAAASDTVDLVVLSTTRPLGIVQEDIDQVKVATGKTVANVRLMGITKMFVQTAAGISQGGRVMAGTQGGAVNAAGAGNVPIGICLTAGTIAAGDLIDVLLTPGMPVM